MPSKILVVDDERNIRESCLRLLQRKNYDAEGAESGAEALEKIGEKVYDLVLLDVRMPGMDGIEVLRRAREMVPDILILILTGHGTIDTAIEAMELGAIGFIRKPIAIDHLARSIDEALERGRMRKDNARLRALLPLFEMNKVFLSEVDEAKIVSLILETVASETGADITQVMLWDNEGNIIFNASNKLPPVGESEVKAADEMVKRAASTLAPVVVSREAGTVLDTWDEIHLQHAGCDIYLPLVARGKAIGVLKVTKLENNVPFRPSDVEFLFTLCGQCAIAITNAKLFESVEKEHAEVEKLLRRVITTTEDERQRISLELHDGPVQSIVASQFAVETCRTLISKKSLDGVEDRLHSIKQMLLQSTKDLRRIVCDLHPPDLDKSGLLTAVQDYLSDVERADEIKCGFEVRGTTVPLAHSTERGVFYVVREAITNARKHAEASEIHVTFEFADNNLTVEVSDNGKGFDPTTDDVYFKAGHLGIRSMKERAKALSGSLTIESKPRKMTTVRLVVPLDKETD